MKKLSRNLRKLKIEPISYGLIYNNSQKILKINNCLFQKNCKKIDKLNEKSQE